MASISTVALGVDDVNHCVEASSQRAQRRLQDALTVLQLNKIPRLKSVRIGGEWNECVHSKTREDFCRTKGGQLENPRARG